MIERKTFEGRPATVAYLTADFKPADRDKATAMKVIYDDGEVVFLTRSDDAEEE